MKCAKIVIFVGIIPLIMGIIFHLQGNSIVGPESSFMYSNPDWITYGLEISIAGVVITGIGFLLIFVKN
ncbi:hypothetical protein NsoK4_01930 [Nitrosopumilus sp. K4]|nr:hypothetical protein NsoK4_01930 [Nitrosopumilus sp. K4]